MAYRRRRRFRPRTRRFKRRNYRRRPRRYRRIRRRSIIRAPVGIPQTYACKLRYAHDAIIDVAVGSSYDHVFRTNNVYDPDYSIGGHQPRFFDQLMTLYASCYVVGSVIRVRASNANNAVIHPCDMSLFMHEDPTYASGLSTYQDTVESKYRKGGPVMIGGGLSFGDKHQSWLTAKFSAKKFFHLAKVVGDRHYVCTNSAGPDREGYFQTHLKHIQGNDPGAVRVEYRLTYFCVFTDPRYQAES